MSQLRILKWQLGLGKNEIRGCYTPLHVNWQKGVLMLWGQGDPDDMETKKTFMVVQTGEDVPVPAAYVGTGILDLGPREIPGLAPHEPWVPAYYVLHVFEMM